MNSETKSKNRTSTTHLLSVERICFIAATTLQTSICFLCISEKKQNNRKTDGCLDKENIINISERQNTLKQTSLVPVLLSTTQTTSSYVTIAPLWRSKVKSKRHLHSACAQDAPVSQKPPSQTEQGHNLWRGGSVFSRCDHSLNPVSCIVTHPPGWPGPAEFCRPCRSSPE